MRGGNPGLCVRDLRFHFPVHVMVYLDKVHHTTTETLETPGLGYVGGWVLLREGHEALRNRCFWRRKQAVHSGESF